MDLFIFIKYYLPHNKYVIFIGKIKDLLSDLEGKILYEEAFLRVKNGIRLSARFNILGRKQKMYRRVSFELLRIKVLYS